VIVDAVLAGELLLVSSRLLLEELERVRRYPKLAKVFPDPAGIVERVRAIADVVEPGMALNVADDGPDNRVLEAVVEARVDAIVTGDGGLLDLATYDGIRSCRRRPSWSGARARRDDAV
jgi:putative PIN family toxin of toxin-antitoxin system